MDEWKHIADDLPIKGIHHAVIVDLLNLLVDSNNGLVENLRHMKGFEITEEDLERVRESTGEVNDE